MSRSKQDNTEYVFDRVIEFPGMTARIYRPVLTDEERARRMKEIHDAAADLLKERYRMERQRQQHA